MSQTLSLQEAKSVNKLEYRLPVNPSVVNSRTFKQYNFSNATYSPGATAQCIVNSGSDAVWGTTSYVKMSVAITGSGNNTVYFGGATYGSGVNLIKNVRLTHRSGEVLEDIRNVDKLGTLLRRWTQSKDSFEMTAGAEGGSGVLLAAGAGTIDIVVPLRWLLGMFNRTDQYIPPGLLAGSKLEFDLNTNARALDATQTSGGDAAAPATYSITSIQLVLDSADLYDSIKKDLLEEQMDVKRSGLQFTYNTWFGSSYTADGGAVNIDLQKSASLANVAIVSQQLTSKNADSYNSNGVLFSTDDVTGWNFRLGSQYLPTQVPVSSVPEGFLLTTSAMDALPRQNDRSAYNKSSVKYSDYVAADGNNQSMIACSLESSAAGLDMTGAACNNSRILNFNAEASTASSTMFVYLGYVRVANVLGASIVVDS